MAKARSEIFALCDEYFDKTLEYDAISSTYANDNSQDHQWNDYSFHPEDPFVKIVKKYKKLIEAEEPVDTYDELAQKIILRDMQEYIDNVNDYKNYVDFGSVYSEPESIFEVFEAMPKETKKDILNITKRMEKIPSALNQWADCLHDVSRIGVMNAKLRVSYLVDILDNYASGMMVSLAKDIDLENKRLLKAAKEAERSFSMLSAWLKTEYIPNAPEKWAVGEEEYIKLVKIQSGLTINPYDIYRWGVDELNNINYEMRELAKTMGEFESLTDVRDYLNNNPKYIIEGADNFKAFLEGVTKKAIKDLNGTVFTIPPIMKKCEVVLDDSTIDESPYYKEPSDDFSRPGRTYYPTLGRTHFSTWENYSTWFHESVPGHHMQFAAAKLNKETITRYQRESAWNSGYGEGWALYSERLMDELGYFDDPGYKMGYLMCQAMRAARLVVDIGLHLEYTNPYDNTTWGPETAVRFMEDFALLNHDYAISEVKRYISWPGQAITYKLGERIWLSVREKAKSRLGDKFNLKKFHNYALNLGPMGLDMLEEELDKWSGK